MPDDVKNVGVKSLSDSDKKVLEGTAETPDIYFNGFVNGMSQGDIRIGLVMNGRPVGGLNCSPIMTC